MKRNFCECGNCHEWHEYANEYTHLNHTRKGVKDEMIIVVRGHGARGFRIYTKTKHLALLGPI